MFYAITNYQFKRSELKNVEKLVKQMCIFVCEIVFLVGGPWKSDVVLEKSLKNGCNLLYEPWFLTELFMADWVTD